jgi:hypothetical protein
MDAINHQSVCLVYGIVLPTLMGFHSDFNGILQGLMIDDDDPLVN